MPIVRGIAGAIVFLLLTPNTSQSQESAELTLVTAVATAQARNPAIAAAFLAAEAAENRVAQVGKWANPQLSVYQENFPGAVPGANQWIISLSQRVRIGGQLGRSTDLAAANQKAMAKDAEAVRWRIGLRVQHEYAAGYSLQRRLEVVFEVTETARSLLRDMAARLVEEDVSDYDVRRLRREVEALDVRTVTLGSEASSVGTRLAALTGISVPADGWRFAAPDRQQGGPPPLGELAVGPVTRPDTGGRGGAATVRRPDLEAAVERRRAAGLAERLARRQAVPDLIFTAGYSRLDPGWNGFVWSVGVTLPVFDRRRDEVAALVVEQSQRDREIAFLKIEAKSEQEQARQGYRDATGALLQIETGAATDLIPIARVAYEEGEMNVMEFVDALRTDLDSRMRRIELGQQRAVQWFNWRWALGEGRQGVSR